MPDLRQYPNAPTPREWWMWIGISVPVAAVLALVFSCVMCFAFDVLGFLETAVFWFCLIVPAVVVALPFGVLVVCRDWRERGRLFRQHVRRRS